MFSSLSCFIGKPIFLRSKPQHCKQVTICFRSIGKDGILASRAYAPGRLVDHALEIDFVLCVGKQEEQRQGIFYLFTFIELQRANYLVGNACTFEHRLKGYGLRIGPVQYCTLIETSVFLNNCSNTQGFILLVLDIEQVGLSSLSICSPKLFFVSSLVVLDDTIGNFQDILC